MDDLITERLVLHPMTLDEAEQVLAGDPDDASRWAPGYHAVSGVRGFLQRFKETGDPRPFGNYVIRRREDGYPIGGIGFFGPPNEQGVVTVGYGLAPEARGKGYATEALRELVCVARQNGAVAVEADTDHANVASQGVLVKAGMRLVAEDERLRYYRLAWDDSAG